MSIDCGLPREHVSQVTKFSTDELAEMINEVSGENLTGIEVFGGFLGLASGTLTVVS